MGPDVNQLKAVISAGDDSKHNVLLLCKDGSFKLIEGFGGEAVAHLNFVSRWETFEAGNGYAGTAAAADDGWMNKVMQKANEDWKRYQKSLS